MPILPLALRGLGSDTVSAFRPALRALRPGHAPQVDPGLVQQPPFKALLLALRNDHPATWRSLNQIAAAEEPGMMPNSGEYWNDRGHLWLSHERAFNTPAPAALETLGHEFGHARRSLNPLQNFRDLRRLRARTARTGSMSGAGYETAPDEMDARAFGYARAFDFVDPQQPALFPWDATYEAVLAGRPQQPVLSTMEHRAAAEALRTALADVDAYDEPLTRSEAWQPALPFIPIQRR